MTNRYLYFVNIGFNLVTVPEIGVRLQLSKKCAAEIKKPTFLFNLAETMLAIFFTYFPCYIAFIRRVVNYFE